MSMDPTPAEGWPEGPLSEEAARDLLFDREAAVAVWVMDHDEATRNAILGPDAPEGAVIDVIVETGDAFELYSYTHHDGDTKWVAYGEESKAGDGATAMAGTLESYRLLAGESDL